LSKFFSLEDPVQCTDSFAANVETTYILRMKIGRNEPCSCGSGKKYKQCCEKKTIEKSDRFTKWAAIVFGGLLLIGVLVMASSMVNNDAPANAGRVWSPEHQHWH
jgi:SEC-C motif